MGLLDDLIDVRLVVVAEGAAEGVGAEMLDEGAMESGGILQDQLLELIGILEPAPTGHRPGGIHHGILALSRGHALLGAPLTDGVVVFPGEAQRIDAAVAGGAVRIRGVDFQSLTDRHLVAFRRHRFDGIDVCRRWRRRFVEDGLAEPDTAMDGAVAGAVGGQAEHRAHGEQAAALVLGLERDALEAVRLRFGQAVESTEARIRHRPIGVDELFEGTVLGEHLLEELHRLSAQACFQPLVVGGIELLVRRKHAHPVQLQPLAREVFDETVDPAVGQKAVHFFFQSLAFQGSFAGGDSERVVRHGTPEEIGKAGGQLPVVEVVADLRLTFDEVEEVPGGEQALQRDLIGGGQRHAGLALGTVGGEIDIQLLQPDRPTPGALGEALQMLGDDLRRGVSGRQDALARGFFGLGFQRSFPFDPVEEDHGVDGVPLVVEHRRGDGMEQMVLAAVREHIQGLVGDVADVVRALGDFIDFRGNDFESQLRGSFQKHLDFINLRAVLRGGDVEFDQTADGIGAGLLADSQVGKGAAWGTHAAGLETHAVEAARHRGVPAEPLRSEGHIKPLLGMRHVGQHQVAQGALDAEMVRPLLLVAAVAQLGGGLADLLRRQWRGGEGPAQDRLRGTVVALHVGGRECQLGPDALVAVP